MTELDSYDPDRLREIVRSRPGVGQLFVLNPDGSLLHPDPAGTLNDSEREFLLRAREIFDDKELIRNGSAHENDAVPATHGWHVRYWGPGLNLIFYHRLESGKVVGVLVPRSRWIADLIAELPETAPEARVKLWKELNIMPRGIDREVVETMHRTHMGVDAEYKNIIKQGLRTSLSDGWGGAMIATELQDALFGTPNPLSRCVHAHAA